MGPKWTGPSGSYGGSKVRLAQIVDCGGPVLPYGRTVSLPGWRGLQAGLAGAYRHPGRREAPRVFFGAAPQTGHAAGTDVANSGERLVGVPVGPATLAKCLAKRSASTNGGGVSISRPSRAGESTAGRRQTVLTDFARVRAGPQSEAVLQDRLHRARPGAVGMSGLQVLAPSQEVSQARLMRRLLEAAIGHPPVPHQHAGEVGAENRRRIVDSTSLLGIFGPPAHSPAIWR